MPEQPMETECLRCHKTFMFTIAQAMQHDKECKG